MTKPYFSKDLIKAVNNWQVGSVGKSKKADAIAKAISASPLDPYLTGCDDLCYRRSVLVPAAVKRLFFHFSVPEETSSWTVWKSIAVDFKGGPPNPPNPGVIFAHKPSPKEIVLNLDRLYQHSEFPKSVLHWKSHGLDVSKGIDRWDNSQHEVVIKLEDVPHTQIHAFGSNAAGDMLDGKVGVPMIGATVLDKDAITKVFQEFGLPTKKWIFDESAGRAYCAWIERVIKRLS